MRRGPQGPPPLWLIALIVLGLVLAAAVSGLPETKTLIAVVGTLVGTLSGALGGIWFESWLRARGDVNCELGAYNPMAFRIASDGTFAEEMPVENVEAFREFSRRGGEVKVAHNLDLRFFNGKGEPTGLSDLSVAFIGERGQSVVLDRNSEGYWSAYPGSGPRGNIAHDVVNLPAQTWVGIYLSSNIAGEEGARSLAWERIEVRARYPNNEPFRRVVRDSRS
jgi:hypothetical protein